MQNVPLIYVLIAVALGGLAYVILAGHVNFGRRVVPAGPDLPEPMQAAEPLPVHHREPKPPEPPSLQVVTAECRTAESHLRKAADVARECGINADALATLADQIEQVKIGLLHEEITNAATQPNDWHANRKRHAAEQELKGPVTLVPPVAVKVATDKAA